VLVVHCWEIWVAVVKTVGIIFFFLFFLVLEESETAAHVEDAPVILTTELRVLEAAVLRGRTAEATNWSKKKISTREGTHVAVSGSPAMVPTRRVYYMT
jgi:hypothetical protein